MSLFGIEGGLAGKVNSLGLSFQIKGPVEKSRLREILIDCTEEFLHEININEKLRPHLKNYPFTTHELNIALFVVASDGGWLNHPHISTATSRRGKLRYVTYKEDHFEYQSEVEENYEEALRIVKGH